MQVHAYLNFDGRWEEEILCEGILPNEPPGAPAPDTMASGAGALFIVGAIDGG